MQQRSNQAEIFLHLGRLEGKVDAILANQTSMANQLEDHDKRIGNLELFKAWQLGASAVIASLVAACVGYFKGGQ